MIVLQDHPGTWPESRKKSGLLGTWLNHLEWDKAEKFNLKPVEKAPRRRCNQPFLYVNVSSRGEYLLCCQDGMQVTRGMFGGVDSGVEGFKKFWLGERMQGIRAKLRNKDRAAITYACAKCDVCHSRCDFRHWTDEQVSKVYEGKDIPMEEVVANE